MEKKYFIFTAIGLVIFGYVLDYISGPIYLVLTNPFSFLEQASISMYPLTAVSIAAKTLAIIISVPLALSYMSRKYILKCISIFVLAALCELYAIQQIATGQMTTPIQWTLAIAYAGVGLLIPSLFYLILIPLQKGKKLLGDDNDEDFTLKKPL